MSFYEKLNKIQTELHAPKNQKNTFGNYNYRNCEDILEALKPLLAETKLALNISDEIVCVGTRTYVKATVKLTDGEISAESTAFAREAETKKGMDESQITGSASSYARKYALNGLFCIDDTKDADSQDNSIKDTKDKKEPSDFRQKANESVQRSDNSEFLTKEEEEELKKNNTKLWAKLKTKHNGKIPASEIQEAA